MAASRNRGVLGTEQLSRGYEPLRDPLAREPLPLEAVRDLLGLRARSYVVRMEAGATPAGLAKILFHARWAYGVNMGFWLSLFAGLAVSLGKTGRLQFELGKRTKGGAVEEIHPSTSFAAFYWWVRYQSVLHEDDCHEARDHHHHENLEGAIRL